MNCSYLSDAAIRALYSSRLVFVLVLLGCTVLAAGFKVVDRLAPGQIQPAVFAENGLTSIAVDCGAFVAIMILGSGGD